MPSPVGVRVTGLRQFQSGLAKAAAYEPGLVRAELHEVAQIVVDEIIPEMKSQFVSDPSRLDGRLEDSVRTLASESKRRPQASVAVGWKAESRMPPYAGPWEFGGYPRGRPFVKEGRVILPVAKRKRGEMVARLEAAMVRLAAMIEGRG